MSRRGNASEGGSSSPIKHYLRWHADGHAEFYNGTENEKMESLNLVVLDIRSSVTGWYDAGSCKLSSNMVKALDKEELAVRELKKGGKVLIEGIWKTISENVKNKLGGKFTTNIIAMDVDTEQIVVLQLAGDNLNAWVNFKATTTETELYNSILSVTAGEKKKKGGTVWTIPAFELKKLTPKADKKAEEMFEVLDAYFSEPSARKANAQDEAPSAPKARQQVEDEDDGLPF